MKRFLKKLALILICLMVLICPAQAVANFTDVPQSHWGAAYIDRCYDLGLMIGTSDTTFSPSGTLTVAQAITASVRIHGFCTGNTIVLDQSGANWYDGAVSEALKLGIMEEAWFDNYNRPATRAELAGLLGNALPDIQYRAINTVEKLPDVDESTPYAQEILKLYRAGILTGNDKYGTFTPYKNISRVELATIMCRLAAADTRVAFTLIPKPADTTVRTTSCRLVICGIPVYGVVEMDGKYYIPGEILDDTNTLPDRLLYLNNRSGEYSIQINPDNLKYAKSYIAQTYSAPEGIVMGKAAPSDLKFVYNKEEADAVLYEIDGRYQLVPLDAMGATRSGNDFVIYPEYADKFELTAEPDLIGDIPGTLKKDTSRKTVIAVHDYLINKLTYDPRVSMSYTTEENNARIDKLWAEAEKKYSYDNNLVLATGYGVCQNYTELFQNFCNRLGIPCILVSGVGNGDSHAWNMVYIEGKWLYVDCTFDDPVGRKPQLRWKYCLVGPDVMAVDHCWRGDDYPMPDEYDPAWEKLDPNNITSADMFRKCLIAQMMQKKTNISLRVTKSGAYGGIACIYKYQTQFWQMSGRYDSATGCYKYTVKYMDW